MNDERLAKANELRRGITAVELDITRLKESAPLDVSTNIFGIQIPNVPMETNKIVKQICIASLEDLLASLKAECEAL